ncbi:hypothetical protein C8Q77DRAFT_1145482 [Trametes polyzona]|nr:hypothetical protein C8Q77DRAFT_1145482 [Trametes polyzona]
MSCDDHEDPPWYVRDPATGDIDILAIPERLRNHPELRQRGITLTDTIKPGVVYTRLSGPQPHYVVKVLSYGNEELPIYQYLLGLDPTSPNHTLPCTLTRSGHPLLIMPCLTTLLLVFRPPAGWTLYALLGVFLQLVEGIELLHRHRIAHMDFCLQNFLVATHVEAAVHDKIVAQKIYIIDYDRSRRFDHGPGAQRAVKLPSTQIRPPNGATRLDPYSWDVFCLGRVMQDIIKYETPDYTHPITRWYIRWLLGSEHGCTGVCRCRPTAQRARQVLALVRGLVYIADVCVGWLSCTTEVIARFLRS